MYTYYVIYIKIISFVLSQNVKVRSPNNIDQHFSIEAYIIDLKECFELKQSTKLEARVVCQILTMDPNWSMGFSVQSAVKMLMYKNSDTKTFFKWTLNKQGFEL